MSSPRPDLPLLAALRSTTREEREAGWRAFHAQHARFVYAVVARSGVPPDDVPDLFQRVFMVVHARIGQQDIRSVRPWLRAIALRVVLEHRRYHRVRRAKAWVLRWMVEDDERRVPTPERTFEQAEAVETIWAGLGALNEKLRGVIILCDLQGCTPSEAAEVLGVPVNTVRSRRRVAKEQLVRWIERRRRSARGRG